MFEIITCPQIPCFLFPEKTTKLDSNDIGDCGTYATFILIEFFHLIPQYEIRCSQQPTYLYPMPYGYTRKHIEVYKQQLYVTYASSTVKNKYNLIFTNIAFAEICHFSIRNFPKIGERNETYRSDCGGGGITKDCYAPCRNVQLEYNESPIVDIMIKTRHHDFNNDSSGYFFKKFGMIILCS